MIYELKMEGLVRMIGGWMMTVGQRTVDRVHRARFERLSDSAIRVRAVAQNVLVVDLVVLFAGGCVVVLIADDQVIVAGQWMGFGEVAAVVIDQYLVLRAAGQVVLRGGHTIAADLQAVTVTAIRQRETVRVV